MAQLHSAEQQIPCPVGGAVRRIWTAVKCSPGHTPGAPFLPSARHNTMGSIKAEHAVHAMCNWAVLLQTCPDLALQAQIGKKGSMP